MFQDGSIEVHEESTFAAPPPSIDGDETGGAAMTLSLAPRPPERASWLFAWVLGASLLAHAPAAYGLARSYHPAHREHEQQVEIQMLPPAPPEPPPPEPPPPPDETPRVAPHEVPRTSRPQSLARTVVEPSAPLGDTPNIVATPGDLPPPPAPVAVAPPEPPAAPQPPPPPVPVVQASEGAHYRSNTRPGYPRMALRAGWEGTVYLRVRVLPDGHVANAAIERSAGHAVLDDAALAVVGSWLFDAATQGGRPVPTVVTVPIAFHMQQ
jgi:protein TonB